MLALPGADSAARKLDCLKQSSFKKSCIMSVLHGGPAERCPTKDLRERNLVGRDSVEPRMFDSALIGAALPSRPLAIRVNRPYLSTRCTGVCVKRRCYKK